MESFGEMILNIISRTKNDSAFTIPAAPRSTLCSMIIRSFCGKGTNVTIANRTNGEKLKIEQELKRSQKVTFIRQYTVIGDKRLKTSGRLPTLDVGWNDFEIINSDDFEILFDTRFIISKEG